MIDELLKSQFWPVFVIPVKAGIQLLSMLWIPACAGMTDWGTFYEGVKNIRRQHFSMTQIFLTARGSMLHKYPHAETKQTHDRHQL